ncbi:MAG: hypothetical protein AB7Q97_04075 [Gammaproteobacteria bacterium]
MDDEFLSCPLCRAQVDAACDCVATPVFLTRRDPLWRYAGRRIHRRCFLAWPLRAEFVRKFNVVGAGLVRMGGSGEIEEIFGT